MRKIITFLGKYPKETRYTFGGQIYEGKVFAEALRQFVAFDEMLVFVTDEARADAWPVLAKLNDARIRAVSIRKGAETAEMWDIFEAVTSSVGEGETVIFDITHGLRSLPFLVFLFAAYLKTAKHVTIEAIYYGALELGDPLTNKPAPVIDMSPFVGMLDWLTAAERFVRFGDSQDLASLLRRAEGSAPDTPLGGVAESLEKLSQSLRLIRPADAMETSAQLPATILAAQSRAQENPAALPYRFLASDLERAYAPFALAAPFDAAQLESSLAKQRDLIHWYLDRQQWVQAVSLAREWLITWVMWHLGETDFLDQPLRESIAELMSKEAQRRQAAKGEKRPFNSILLRSVPQVSKVLGDWLSLAGIRNDIDHAGMRAHARPAKELTASVKTLCGNLSKLPLAREGAGQR